MVFKLKPEELATLVSDITRKWNTGTDAYFKFSYQEEEKTFRIVGIDMSEDYFPMYTGYKKIRLFFQASENKY